MCMCVLFFLQLASVWNKDWLIDYQLFMLYALLFITRSNYCKLMTSSIGWMSTKELNTSMWWCTGVCMTLRFGTSLITSSQTQPLMLLLSVFVYDPLTWIVPLFLAACRLPSNLAVYGWQAFYHVGPIQPRSLCQINVEIVTVLMALNDSGKQFFSRHYSVARAL